MSMTVKVILPSGIFLEQQAMKVVAEGRNGSFCLLPRHTDFVSALVPGILSISPDQTTEIFLAIDEGILVKHGADVLISTWNAVAGALGELHTAVQKQFRERGEQEQQARQALEHLEASLVRQILGRDGK